MRETSKRKIYFLRWGKKTTKKSVILFGIIIILNKFRKTISCDLAVLPPAVFDWSICYKSLTFISSPWHACRAKTAQVLLSSTHYCGAHPHGATGQRWGTPQVVMWVPWWADTLLLPSRWAQGTLVGAKTQEKVLWLSHNWTNLCMSLIAKVWTLLLCYMTLHFFSTSSRLTWLYRN